MHARLREAFEAEMTQARERFAAAELDAAFACLERAHVLGQRFVVPHTRTHVWMLRVGLRRRDPWEVFGQLLRIPTGALGSAIGLVPTGNTGGAHVPALKRMPIPEELRLVMEEPERALEQDAEPEGQDAGDGQDTAGAARQP